MTANSLRQSIERFNKKIEEKARAEQRYNTEYEKSTKKIEAFKSTRIMPNLRRGTPADYGGWLRGYIERGGEPTNYYDADASRFDFYVAISDFPMIALNGAHALNIIVPENIRFLMGDGFREENLGHSTLYFMRGYTYISGLGMWVPYFKNIPLLL